MMPKTRLSYTFLMILSAAAYADITPSTNSATTTAPITTQETTTTVTPAPETPTVANPEDATLKTTTTTTTQSITAPINCQLHIPPTTTTIDSATITTWASNAVMQSFNFNYNDIDKQLISLKDCFTEEGFQGFNDALKQSGNVSAIKTQHMTVSSQVDGTPTLNSIKDNEWKITLPMQVVYQNDKEKLTQLLSVEVLITRKVSGDLGILQMVATPRPAVPAKP